MIELTRLNGNPMVLNSDLIKTAEASPDTMLTLINGEKLIVRERLRRSGGTRARLPRAPAGLGRRRLPSYGELQRVVSLPASTFPASPRRRSAQSARDPTAPLRKADEFPLSALFFEEFSWIRAALAESSGHRRHRGRIAHRRRQPGPDSAADRGPDRLWRHHGRGAAPVSAHHGAGRIPQPGARLFRAAQAERPAHRLLVAFANKARRNGVVSLDSDLQTIRIRFSSRPSCWPSTAPSPAELRKIMRVSLDSTAEAKSAARGLRVRRRLLAHHRHSGRGAGPHSGHAASGQHSGGGPRHRRGLRRHHLRRGHRQSLLPALRRQDAHPHPRRHQRREMMLEGVISILEGMNPRMLEVKLAASSNDPPRKEGARGMRQASGARATSATIAGWSPMPTSSPCSSASSWSSTPSPRPTRKSRRRSPSPSTPPSNLWASFPTPRAAANGAAAASAPTRPAIPMNIVMGEDVLSPAKVKDDLDHIRRELEQTLSNQVATHTVSIQMGRDGLVISLREAGFFNSGSATPKPETLPTLRQIAASLGRTPYDLRIEGHTDNIPIHNAEFDSNWELSSARATRIARLFLDMKAIPRSASRPPATPSSTPWPATTPPRAARKPPRRSGRPAPRSSSCCSLIAPDVIKVTQKFRLGIVAATGGIFFFYLIEMVLGFFGIQFTSHQRLRPHRHRLQPDHCRHRRPQSGARFRLHRAGRAGRRSQIYGVVRRLRHHGHAGLALSGDSAPALQIAQQKLETVFCNFGSPSESSSMGSSRAPQSALQSPPVSCPWSQAGRTPSPGSTPP
jgi:flagellar motor protein MotB